MSTCGVWSDPPERRPLLTTRNPIPPGCAARPVCAELAAESQMRLDSSSLASSSTLDMAATPRRVCSSEAVRATTVRCLPPPFVQRPQKPVQRNFLDKG